MSRLAENLPEEMISFLDSRPEKYPEKAMSKITALVGLLSKDEFKQGFCNLMRRRLRTFFIFPWYWYAGKKMKQIPGAPKLKGFSSLSNLKNMAHQLHSMETAAQYSACRSKAIPLEQQLAQLPSLEASTKKIQNLSFQIEQAAKEELELDINRRLGLMPEVDRAEITGLPAAIRSK